MTNDKRLDKYHQAPLKSQCPKVVAHQEGL